MNESTLKPLSGRKAAFGISAIVCFCGGAGLLWHGSHLFMENLPGWAAAVGGTQGHPGWWDHDYAIFGGLILWVLGLVFAVTGLVRAERPRWPAIVGLVLCMLPLALFLFGWAYNAIHHE